MQWHCGPALQCFTTIAISTSWLVTPASRHSGPSREHPSELRAHVSGSPRRRPGAPCERQELIDEARTECAGAVVVTFSPQRLKVTDPVSFFLSCLPLPVKATGNGVPVAAT